jgi:hypothetical protein
MDSRSISAIQLPLVCRIFIDSCNVIYSHYQAWLKAEHPGILEDFSHVAELGIALEAPKCRSSFGEWRFHRLFNGVLSCNAQANHGLSPAIFQP